MGKLLALKGSVFRLRKLHADRLSSIELQRSEAGDLASAQSTVAHLPSLYYWLQVRGGISFTEAAALVKAGRILLGGKPVTGDEALLQQAPWQEMAQLDLKIINWKGRTVDPQHRALHRQYYFLLNVKGLDLINTVENPLSFVHSLTKPDPAGLSSFSVLRPAGTLRTTRGLWLATNDVQIKPIWQSETLGNFGVYSVRFHAGCPDEIIEATRQRIESELALIARLMPTDIKVPFTAKICDLPIETPDFITRADPRPNIRSKHILVSTPRFPISVATKMRGYVASVFLLKNGPFDCRAECNLSAGIPAPCPLSHTSKPMWSSFLKEPSIDGDNATALIGRQEKLREFHNKRQTAQIGGERSTRGEVTHGKDISPLWHSLFDCCRLLERQELVQLYTFERKLKTNKVILGLRELQGVGAAGTRNDVEDLAESMRMSADINPVPIVHNH